jgi:hypothetical protein
LRSPVEPAVVSGLLGEYPTSADQISEFGEISDLSRISRSTHHLVQTGFWFRR